MSVIQRCNNCAYYLYEAGSTICLAAEPDVAIAPNPEAETNCPHWEEISWSDRHQHDKATQERVFVVGEER